MNVALTKSRLSNALRCYAAYALSHCGSVHFAFMPLFVSVEPSALCQLHCPECPVGMNGSKRNLADNEKYMSKEVWQRILTEIAPTAFTIQFYFQGEPLLNNNLPQMIEDAHKQGLYTIVSTNAQAMTPELAEALLRAGLSRIIISMDGLTDQTYNAYRVGGNLNKCKQALTWLREAKERIKASTVIELQCLRLRTNEHEWKQFRKEYKSLGVDRLVFKTAQLYDYANGNPLMPSQSKFSRYIKGKDGLFHRKNFNGVCSRVYRGCVITTTGDVLPCCYDKSHAHAYGNIMNAHMRELFCNDKAWAFRQAAAKELPAICKQCWR